MARSSTSSAASHTNAGQPLLSLELGGDPNDSRNLWVEPQDPGHKGDGVNSKQDPVESRLHTAVCDGQVSLAAAQKAIASDALLCHLVGC